MPRGTGSRPAPQRGGGGAAGQPDGCPFLPLLAAPKGLYTTLLRSTSGSPSHPTHPTLPPPVFRTSHPMHRTFLGCLAPGRAFTRRQLAVCCGSQLHPAACKGPRRPPSQPTHLVVISSSSHLRALAFGLRSLLLYWAPTARPSGPPPAPAPAPHFVLRPRRTARSLSSAALFVVCKHLL